MWDVRGVQEPTEGWNNESNKIHKIALGAGYGVHTCSPNTLGGRKITRLSPARALRLAVVGDCTCFITN